MKTILFWTHLIILCLCFSKYTECEEIAIRIVTEEWAPYNYVKNDILTGYSVEIVNALMDMTENRYNIELLPGVRSKYILSSKENIMMFTVFRTPEREDLYKWIGPIDSGSIFFYKRADNPLEINSIEDAKNVEIIACRYAGLIPDLLYSMGFTNLETSAIDSIQIYTKLLLGRCDLGISDTDLGVIYYLKEIGVPTNALTKIPIKVFEADLYIACSIDMPDSFVDEWQRNLEILKKSEMFEDIRNKYYH